MRLSVIAAALLSVSCNAPERKTAGTAVPVVVGIRDNGKQLIEKYACLACHRIPGFDGAQGSLGPSLEGITSHATIAGGAPNNVETMTAYLQNPQAVHPDATMPALGMTPEEARDITAYLFTLK